MKCNKVRLILPELVSGELTGRNLDEATAHIESCPACQTEMREYKSALGAIANAWTSVETPTALEFVEIPDAKFSILRFGIAGACLVLALVVTILTIGLRRNCIVENVVIQAKCPPSESRETNVKPAIQPAPDKKSAEKAGEVDGKSEHEPAKRIEKPEHKWDERRFRPPKAWANTAFHQPKPKPKADNSQQIVAESASSSNTITTPDAEKPQLVSVAQVRPVDPVPDDSAEVEKVPATQKITRQIVTYDRYGNQQMAQIEVEEPSPQPCMMAF